MERQFLSVLKGYVRIKICGNSYDRFLNLCGFHGIRIWDLLPSGDSYEANLSLKDFRKLRSITKKSHVKVRIVGRHGLPFFIYKYRKRKFFLFGIAVSVLFMFWLSAHIWNIHIDGNVSQTDDVIFEYLEQQGIVHGIQKSQVNCKNLAAELRNYFSDFSWVSVKMKGTRLEISIKEGIIQEDSRTELSYASVRSSLIAAAAGTVESVYVRSGISLVEEGDEVEPGMILVSGAIPIRDDSGTVISWQYVHADADIIIRRRISYHDEVMFEENIKEYTGNEKNCCQLLAGKYSFALPHSFTEYETCDIVTELKQLRLTENFYLPFYIRKFTVREYHYTVVRNTAEKTEQLLLSNLEYFMKKLEEKGLQIFENDVKIEWNEMSAAASGYLTVGEPAFERSAVGHTEEELLKHEYG